MADNSEIINRNKRNYGTILEEQNDGESSANNLIATMSDTKSTLTIWEKLGYGLGHVYNDLCASIWFSYTLLFMQAVRQIPGTEAGGLVMFGQISDAISTPLVGHLVDRYWTKRKWHILGTLLVFLSFPMIFSLCPFCDISPIWWQPLYFAIFILIFQFAWAVIQITHLAMIPELSKTSKDRSDLTTMRYTASVCSSVTVYIVTWIIFQGRTNLDKNIGPQDKYRFRDISLIITLIGFTMSILFQFSLILSYRKKFYKNDYLSNRNNDINEIDNNEINTRISRESITDITSITETEQLITENNSDDDINININNFEPKIHKIKEYLTSIILYQNAFLYVFSRLFFTISLIYMPLWLDEISRQESEQNIVNNNITVDYLATVPLMSFIASFIASLILKYLNRWIKHHLAYLIGSILSICGCIFVLLDEYLSISSFLLFGIATLYGSGISITMISSLCITADMIGAQSKRGGLIYSVVTFADKLITGIAVLSFEGLKCTTRTDCPKYYRDILGYACIAAAILGITTLATMKLYRKNLVINSRS